MVDILGSKESQFIGDGDTIPYTPGSAVVGGEVIVQAGIVGIVASAIAANVLGALQITGRAAFLKKGADNLTLGLKVYWDAGNNEVTLTAAGNTNLGRVLEAADGTKTVVEVLMLPETLDV